jgi:hypothetical protein
MTPRHQASRRSVSSIACHTGDDGARYIQISYVIRDPIIQMRKAHANTVIIRVIHELLEIVNRF